MARHSRGSVGSVVAHSRERFVLIVALVSSASCVEKAARPEPGATGVSKPPVVSDQREQAAEDAGARVGSRPETTRTLPSARELSIDFSFVNAVPSGERLLLVSADGRLQVRDADGHVLGQANTGLVAQRVAVAVPSGWVVLGSLPESVGRDERGAAVQVALDGSTGQRWLAPGRFRSLAATATAVLACDSGGPVYLLQDGGALSRVPAPPEVDGRDTDVAAWGNDVALCRRGNRSKVGDPFGSCQSESGRRVRDIWTTPPIACAGFLVADVQDDGRANSAWSRVVWSADHAAAKVAAHPLSARPTGIACVNDYLVDIATPGKLLDLPALTTAREPLCSNRPDVIVTGKNDVWCLKTKRR